MHHRLLNRIYAGLIFVSLLFWVISSVPPEEIAYAATNLNVVSLAEGKNIAIFPLQTTKKAIQLSSAGYYFDCKAYCHDTYEAADIGAPVGTHVISVVDAYVASVNQSTVIQGKTGGATVRLRGDDGWWYYYAHMKSGSAKVQTGDRVRAGQNLGEVGSSIDAQGSVPHLHFDVSRVENGFDRGAGICSDQCRYLVAPQPLLLKAYLGLPEK